MLSDEDAVRQSQMLGEAGFEMSPRRLQEIDAGARPDPAEMQAVWLVEVVSTVDLSVSPEAAAAAAFERELITWAVLVALAFGFGGLLVLLFVSLHT